VTEKRNRLAANKAAGDGEVGKLSSSAVNHIRKSSQRQPSFQSLREMRHNLSKTSWLWPGWLPRGYVTCVAGEPGVGKSLFTLVGLAGPVVRRKRWPDGSPGPERAGVVVWCDTEASQALLVERVETYALPLGRFAIPGSDPLSSVNLSVADARKDLALFVQKVKPDMLVVDSLSGARKGDSEDSASDTQAVMGSLSELARDEGMAVVVVHHLRKRGVADFGTGDGDLSRLRGSSVLAYQSRVVIVLTQKDEVITAKVVKSNLTKKPEPIGACFDDDKLTWCEAPEVLTRRETTLRVMEAFVKGKLAKGPMRYADLLKAATAEGHTRWQLYKVRDSLGVSTAGGWWKLAR
jgi:RecA-family ATPase